MEWSDVLPDSDCTPTGTESDPITCVAKTDTAPDYNELDPHVKCDLFPSFSNCQG